MPRQVNNIFTRHPRGVEILQKLLREEISQKKAAEVLGCSPANICVHLKKARRLQLELDQQTGTRTITQTEEQTVRFTIDPDVSLDQIGTLAWRQSLLQLIDSINQNNDMSSKEIVILIREIRHFLEFQFQKEVPDPTAGTIQIDPEQVEEIVNNIMGGYCVQCRYYREYLAAEAERQARARAEFT